MQRRFRQAPESAPPHWAVQLAPARPVQNVPYQNPQIEPIPTEVPAAEGGKYVLADFTHWRMSLVGDGAVGVRRRSRGCREFLVEALIL